MGVRGQDRVQEALAEELRPRLTLAEGRRIRSNMRSAARKLGAISEKQDSPCPVPVQEATAVQGT